MVKTPLSVVPQPPPRLEKASTSVRVSPLFSHFQESYPGGNPVGRALL